MKKKENYAIALLLTTLIFFLGVVVGSSITSQRTAELQQALQLDILETQSFDLELSLLEKAGDETVCNYIESRLPDIIKKKVELGRQFDTEDIPEDQAQILESQFVTSLVRFLQFSQIQEERCGIVKPRVLFFFGDSEISRGQAKALDNIVFRLSDENIAVFSFNKGFEDKQPLIKLIYRINNISTVPTIIVNNTKYEGFQSKDRVTEILCRDYDVLNLTIC